MLHPTPGVMPYNNAAEVTKFARCTRCGDDKLSWKKSAKTGRWYLCDVQQCDRWFTRETPVFRYFQLARTPHNCLASAQETACDEPAAEESPR